MIKETWQELSEDWKAKGKSLEELGFRPGASLEKIQGLEKDLGLHLPEDYKQLLQLVNGQFPDGYDCYFYWLLPQVQLLSVEEVLESWTGFQPFINEEWSFWEELQDKGRIRSVPYDNKRIPVAAKEGITDVFLDFIPGPKGHVGQLITNVNEADYIVLAKDFTEFLSNLLTLADKGVIKFGTVKPEYGQKVALLNQQGDFVDAEELVKLFEQYCKKE